MPPKKRAAPPAPARSRNACAGVFSIAMGWLTPAPLWAAPPLPGEAIASPRSGDAPAEAQPASPIDFTADRVEYDSKADTVTAAGNVVLRRDQQSARADAVTYDRKTGQVLATGHVRVIDENGNAVYSDRVTLTDRFITGTMADVLIVLREGGRIAATSAQRDNMGRVTMARAAYTACDIVDASGCPTRPSWRITARRLVYTPADHTLHMYGARLALFDLIRLPLPNLAVPTDGRSISGLLIPSASSSSVNGVGLDATYYLRLAANRDLALTGYIYTKAPPMLALQYRALSDVGAYQLTGYVTRSEVIPQTSSTGIGSQQLRGYIDTNGQFQLSPQWSINFSGRLVSDRTFLSRYYLSSDDELRSRLLAQRIDDQSLLSIGGWAFETLRPGESQGQVPIALPEIDYRRRIAEPWLGGTIDIEGNTLAIARSAGQDTQRAFADAQWSRTRFTPLGQVLTLTTLLRADLYHASGVALGAATVYSGAPGWHTRGEALAAADLTWPLVGSALGGTQVFTPHLQLVAVPPVRNKGLPDEDSQAIELEDSNIFALNRFPGFDRIEDGARLSYGINWRFERPRWRVMADLGQSYSLTGNPHQFPQGVGLYDRVSDVVGRVELRYRDLFKITERFRIDKGNGAFRRNEIDATLGSDRTYVELGYTRVNQGLAAAISDLQDANELRGAARVSFARYWSLFGSGVIDLSNAALVGGSNNSFQPLRNRLGLSYRSDCFEFDLTWRKDYVTIGDAAKGSSFMIHFAFRNIGGH